MSQFINIWDYEDKRYPFQMFIGGRGTGKTYSALEGVSTPSNRAKNGVEKFIYMRRTNDEAELLQDSEKKGEGANPFKPINSNLDIDLGIKKLNKKLGAVYNRELVDGGKYIYTGAPIGYSVGLTAIASMRSLAFNDVTDIFYDEFCPEKHVHKIKGECTALLNAYETVNRNREFEGLPACRLWMLANSNDIYNDYFCELGLVAECEKMIRKGISDKYFEDRGLAVHILPPSKEFVAKKSKTAIAKLTRGTKFYDMAYKNAFAYNDFSLIGRRPIKGYIPFCSINQKAYIYKKKGESEYYVTYAKARVENFNTETTQGARAFMRRYGLGLIDQFTASNVIFESYELKALLLDLLL